MLTGRFSFSRESPKRGKLLGHGRQATLSEELIYVTTARRARCQPRVLSNVNVCTAVAASTFASLITRDGAARALDVSLIRVSLSAWISRNRSAIRRNGWCARRRDAISQPSLLVKSSPRESERASTFTG